MRFENDILTYRILNPAFWVVQEKLYREGKLMLRVFETSEAEKGEMATSLCF